MTDEITLFNRLFCGRLFVLETIPENELLLIPSRRERESMEDWAKRCVRVKNIGELPDAAKAKLLEDRNDG